MKLTVTCNSKSICTPRCLLFLPLLMLGFNATAQHKPTWQNSAYQLYADSVVQGKHVAKATGDSAIVSMYESPANAYVHPGIIYKFAINGIDNEMAPGTDHQFFILSDTTTTDTVKFGTQQKDNRPVPVGFYLQPNSKVTFRLDARHILQSLNEKGYFVSFRRDTIRKENFTGIFIAGNTAPLSWDFQTLSSNEAMKMKDDNADGIYELTLVFNEAKEKTAESRWQLKKDISSFPQYHSPFPLQNALYNLSLEEMITAVEPDSTFRTGAAWAGVWTRDISYSIILSMAYLQPEVAMKSLMRKIKKGRIIQDTGTGGAYPVSTDRMIWAVAAWEIYKVTGNKDWLQQVYPIIKQSIEDDRHNAYDKVTGMVRGESSFLDWREQSYPSWMQPADIYASQNLGTNAVHYGANKALASMAYLLGKPNDAKQHIALADSIKLGINKYLWMADKGYYAQFLYGRTPMTISPRSEALGEALSVLFDIAKPSQQQSIMAKTPVTAFGIPCIYPQIPGIPPYHNNAVWPFVSGYWAMAAAKTGNETALMHAIASIYRPAAMFLTNKENFVAGDGDHKGTQINSSNMLWSLSANLAIVHKILFGIEFDDESLKFKPFVPHALKGLHTLNNFKYRGAMLNITVEGHGNKLVAFYIDDKPTDIASIPGTLTGTYSVRLVLAGNTPGGFINELPLRFSPATPVLERKENKLHISNSTDGLRYRILRNGEDILHNRDLPVLIDTTGYALFQAIELDEKGQQSFASEPLAVYSGSRESNHACEQFVPASSAYNAKGYNGNGYVQISTTANRQLNFDVAVTKDGMYRIDFRYANGNGPVNTLNKCGIRSLYIDQLEAGTFIFPQRGQDAWSDWGYSNTMSVYLTAGKHRFSLRLEPFNENMNGEINEALLDEMRMIWVK